MTKPVDILYRPRGRFRSNYVGAHSSSEVGGYGVFRDQIPFLRYPDARRIDVRATLRDPFGETHVRRFEQRSAIDVYALVDLSGSMGFVGAVDRFDVACGLCAALAYSATRIGDRFGLIGCGDARNPKAILPATRSRNAALAAAAGLRRQRPSGVIADALLAVSEFIGVTRKLLFLISDFRWPERLIEDAFNAFALHDVAPIVLLDSMETSPPRWGLLELADRETDGRRILAMRPALQRRWLEHEAERRRTLVRLAAGRARAPIFVEDRFDPADLSLRLAA